MKFILILRNESPNFLHGLGSAYRISSSELFSEEILKVKLVHCYDRVLFSCIATKNQANNDYSYY